METEEEVSAATTESPPPGAVNTFEGPSAAEVPKPMVLIPKPVEASKPMVLIPRPVEEPKSKPVVSITTTKWKPAIQIPVPKGEKREPVVIIPAPKPKPSIMIQVPKPFPYQKDSAVPWKYEYKVLTNSEQKQESSANITGVGGMTRSGRCYTPEMLAEARRQKAKEVEIDPSAEVEKPTEQRPVATKDVCSFYSSEPFLYKFVLLLGLWTLDLFRIPLKLFLLDRII